MRFRVLRGAVILCAFSIGCGGYGDDDDGGGPPPPNTINVQNNEFNPASLTVSSGTQVTFNWPVGSVGHNVVPSSANPLAAPESGGSGTLRSYPFSFAVTFNATGTFRFFCSSHGQQDGSGNVSGMSGTITVQ